ncbi:alpha-2,8-sialyltransferase 8F-like [Megalobrama amblycephala]|uniref:alpha-2,8-sialyltransferase 8F-like n=1 Tax=Megalobrama amblycephala TaxID=75352 RepID=UPI0020141999|nr:alpha-2,8-sialyltransferase 8F-like [Megalobrama amblycephala]
MALASLQWIVRLLMVLILFQGVCVMFYYTPNTHSSRDVMTETLQQLHCAKLRQKFSIIKPAKSIVLKSFTQELSDFMNCPYKSNKTERELNRVRLQFCCNAKETLMLTKNNTAHNQTIPYETTTKNKPFQMTAELHSMLPEDIPWSGRRLDRCAVVGSGGILKNSSCGREIDSADFVIRFNLAAVNDSDVGMKADLVTINPSQLRYKNLEKNPDPLLERVSVYGNATLIIPAFAYTFCTTNSIKTLKVLQPIRPQQPVVFFSPSYLRTLDRFWKGRGLQEVRLSTGFMLISTALELCEHVHVYGFWPFGSDLQERPVPYHYYDQVTPSRHMHKMPEEFVRLLQLHSQGALTLHLQPCSSPGADLENHL